MLFHYDLAGQLIAETDAAGNMIKAYVWLNGQPLAMIDGGGAVYYFHCDHLGTPQRLTDASGGVVWSGDYLPFGEGDVTVEGVVNNLRFAGQYFDSETGLHYNYHRYYDPKVGRYLRADPSYYPQPKELKLSFSIFKIIVDPQEVNVFSYVQNNPIMWSDQKGLSKYGFDSIYDFSNSISSTGGPPPGVKPPCCNTSPIVCFNRCTTFFWTPMSGDDINGTLKTMGFTYIVCTLTCAMSTCAYDDEVFDPPPLFWR